MEQTITGNEVRRTTGQRSDHVSNTPNNHGHKINQTAIAKELARLNVPEITGIELISEAAEEMDWFMENVMPRTGIGALAGGSDIGKSTELRQLAIDVAAGNPTHLGFRLK